MDWVDNTLAKSQMTEIKFAFLLKTLKMKK